MADIQQACATCVFVRAYDGWGKSNYGNIPFGSIIHQGRKKGPTFWFRKAIAERRKGNLSVLVYPVDKWLLMVAREILGEHADIRNLGDVRWCATEDGSQGKGTGRHIACFVFRPDAICPTPEDAASGTGRGET